MVNLSIPDGWQLVPRVPTEAMHVAGVRTIVRCTGNADWPPRVWAAMLAAAPPAPVVAAGAHPASEMIIQALTKAEDVLSHRPYSAEFWPDGTHPFTGITLIRDALAAARATPSPQQAASPEPAQPTVKQSLTVGADQIKEGQ